MQYVTFDAPYMSVKEGSGIDTIKYHTWPRTPHGKVAPHTQESQEVSPFPAGDHKAAINRQDSMTDTNPIPSFDENN